MKYANAREQFIDWGTLSWKPSTITAYRSDLEIIASTIGDTSKLTLSAFTRESIRKAFSTYGAGKAKTTIERRRSTWRLFFDFLVSENLVPGSPMGAVRKVKLGQRHPKPLKGWDEDLDYKLLVQLRDGCRYVGHECPKPPQRCQRHPFIELDMAIIAMLFATGFRASELLSLNIGSIEGRRGKQTITVTGKGDVERTVPIEPLLDDLLGKYLDGRRERYPTWKPKDSDPLFCTFKTEGTAGGIRMNPAQLDYFLRTALQSAGFGNAAQRGTMAHAFRHTYGTGLVASGAPILQVRTLMGHKSVATTEGYVDLLMEEARSAAGGNTLYKALERISI